MSVRPVERVLIGYSAVAVLVAISRAGRYQAAAAAAVAHALIIVLILLFQAPRVGRFGQLARAIAPIAVLVPLYGGLDLLNGFGAVATLDPLVQRWEASLFAGQPSLTLWRRSPSTTWSAIFHAAYLSYYLIVPFPIGLFLVRREVRALNSALTMVVLSFVSCYLFFIFFPVAGPYYEFPRPADWFVANLPARAVYGILAGGSSYGAAFPSSHVAAAWAAVIATATGGSRAAAPLAILALGLTIGVVYCQMHYAVDALSGIGIGVAAAAIGYRIARGS